MLDLPRFGPEHADCAQCELHPRCHGKRARPVPGMPAIEPSGLMVIGEGPGKNEAIRGEPFVGQAGQVLDDILQAAGFKRNEVHLTNATLGQPPDKQKGEKKDLHNRFPNAIFSCMPRLEAELAHYRPRVVVTMGTAALVAATGYTQKKNTHADNPCEICDPATRKVGPAVQCAVGGCGWTWTARSLTDSAAAELWATECAALGGKCPKCSANIKKLRIGMRKCPACKGKKRKVVVEESFKSDSLALTGKNGMAGALFRAQDLPSRWDEFGVEFVITTLHPAFCLHSSGSEAGFGGQFAALAILDHVEKAKRLLSRPPNWACSITLTDDADEVRAYFARYPSPAIWDADIETDALSAWDVSEIRCIGFGRPDAQEVLVVDTRRMIHVTVTDPNEGKAESEPFEPLTYSIEVMDEDLLGVLREVLTTRPSGWQNGGYDLICMARLWGIEPRDVRIVADTKTAHHCLRPDEPHTLGHIAAGMTDTLFWKEPRKLKGTLQWDNFTQLITYNAKDVRNTSLSRERMVGRIAREV